jgi:hypothetical protein
MLNINYGMMMKIDKMILNYLLIIVFTLMNLKLYIVNLYNLKKRFVLLMMFAELLMEESKLANTSSGRSRGKLICK